MAKQTFTVGQVLTAAQLTSLQQTAMGGGAASAKTASYTLVAADAGTAISMTSTSATTITVNTGLFAAGDTVQITNLGAGVCTITAGTATVNTSASLALAQYESGTLDFTSASAAIFIKGAGGAAASGLTLINRSTFSAVTSHTVDSVFSSTYKSYVIVLEKCAGSAGNLEFQFRYGSTTETGSVYYYYTAVGLFNSATIASGINGSAVANIQFASNSGAALYPTHSTINVSNVGNTAEYATISYLGNVGGGSPGWNSGSGSCWSSQTMTGFLIKAAANIAGSVSVYGLGI